MAEAQWMRAGDAAMLEAAGRVLLRVPGREIAVFKLGEALFAMDDSCPHSGASLCVGRIDAGLGCPWLKSSSSPLKNAWKSSIRRLTRSPPPHWSNKLLLIYNYNKCRLSRLSQTNPCWDLKLSALSSQHGAPLS
jgi:hypothetical protein